jgi:hypothetical protein
VRIVGGADYSVGAYGRKVKSGANEANTGAKDAGWPQIVLRLLRNGTCDDVIF